MHSKATDLHFVKNPIRMFNRSAWLVRLFLGCMPFWRATVQVALSLQQLSSGYCYDWILASKPLTVTERTPVSFTRHIKCVGQSQLFRASLRANANVTWLTATEAMISRWWYVGYIRIIQLGQRWWHRVWNDGWKRITTSKSFLCSSANHTYKRSYRYAESS